MASGQNEKSLRSSMIAGSTWMIGMRWSMRGIGVVSTVILVRLLTPEDFGLVAMSSLFVSLLTVFTSFGVDMALIQKVDADDSYFDTAWTIRFLQSAVVAGLLYLLAQSAANYFGEQRVVPLMQFLSVGILIGGLENIGVVNFRKELDFGKEFFFLVVTKLGAFFVTIALAVWLRNYWALIWGVVSLRLISVVMSYAMHPYRPSFSFRRISELWGFSQWMILRNIGMYLRKQIDTLLIARYFNTSDMGFYSVSKEVSELPTTELIWPIARALFPGYAKLSHDPKYLGLTYLKVLNTISLICIPTGVGLALIAEPLVLVVFGEQWLPIAPVLALLSIYGVLQTIASSVQGPLIALGKIRLVSGIVWAQLVLAIPAVAYAVNEGDLEFVAVIQVGVALAVLPLFFLAMISTSIIRWIDIVVATWRPLISGLAMASCVFILSDKLPDGPVLELLLKSLVGAVVFVLVELFLWVASGRPDGGERALIDLLVPKVSILRFVQGKNE